MDDLLAKLGKVETEMSALLKTNYDAERAHRQGDYALINALELIGEQFAELQPVIQQIITDFQQIEKWYA